MHPHSDYRYRCSKRRMAAVVTLLALATAAVAGEEEEAKPSPPGFPPGIDWTFNFDATAGAFGFGNSLYTNPRPGEPSGDLSDDWAEGSMKAGVEGQYTMKNSSQFYGNLSAVGERTYGAAPSLVGEDASSYDIEDLSIGWRSGDSLETLGENALDFVVGRTQYKLGHGMLLWDGAAEGGARGGLYGDRKSVV